MQGAFDLKVDEYKQVKGVARENLRDQGAEPLKKDAREGGEVAGSTRMDIEKRTGKPVVTGENFKWLTGKGTKKIV